MKFELILDVPLQLEDDTVYVVGEIDDKWVAMMNCPCKCGAIIHLNLLPSTRPTWTWSIADERISISPSIHREDGCRSHFFIKNGLIVWT